MNTIKGVSEAGGTRLVLIDNYDSFTWNLWHLIMQAGADLGVECTVVRNDKLSVQELLDLDVEGYVLSPGPCTPAEAGVCVELCARTTRPVFGVCLGFQAMCVAYGATIRRAQQPMHGKVDLIRTVPPKSKEAKPELFRGINELFTATRYHSLIVQRSSLPATIRVTAELSDGTVMAAEHEERPQYGVQFHPESVMTPAGMQIMENFLGLCAHSKQPENA